MADKLTLNNMNGITNDEDKTCGFTNMNCVDDDDDMIVSITNMNSITEDEDKTCGITDMNCLDEE